MDFTGQTIGQYQVEEKLDKDNPGMSEVYRAYNPLLDRQVVIKILSSALARDPSFVQRFQQEARALARLKHPHIVSVYDAGHYAQFDYLVMEYIPGGSLAGLISREGALPLPRAVTIIKEIASALDYAHESPRKMVHRDIKPANILLDADGSAKLTDFGLVKVAEVSLTVVGQRFGTPAYMPPEQVLPVNDGSPMSGIGPWTDIYSLGVVAYQMLTKRLPFRGTLQQILDAQVKQAAPSMQAFRPEIPAAVDEVILKALNKNPAERYPSAGAFAAALEEAARPYLPISPITPPPQSDNPYATRLVEVVRRPEQLDESAMPTIPPPSPIGNGVLQGQSSAPGVNNAGTNWSGQMPPVRPLPPLSSPVPPAPPVGQLPVSGAASLEMPQRNRTILFIVIGIVALLFILALLVGLLLVRRSGSGDVSPTDSVPAAVVVPTVAGAATLAPAEPTVAPSTPSAVVPTISPTTLPIAISSITATSVFTADLPIRLSIQGSNLDGVTTAELVAPNRASIPLEIEGSEGAAMSLVLSSLPEPVVGAITYELVLNDTPQSGAAVTLQDYSERKAAEGIVAEYLYTNRVASDETSPYTRLRTQPNVGSEAIGTLRNGDQVDILRVEGDWYQLRIAAASDPAQNGITGWLERWLVDNQNVPPPPPTAVPTATRIPALSFNVRVDVNYEGSGNSGQFTSCISGKVLGPGGRPYAGAQVNVNNGPNNSYTGTTNGNGIYSICGLGASHWSVVLQSVPGRQLARQAVGRVYVNGGAQDAIVNFSQR